MTLIRCPHCGRELDPLVGIAPPTPAEGTPIQLPNAAAPTVYYPRGVHPFRTKYKRPASCDDARECQVLNLAGCWHAQVHRITVVNQARFRAIYARLEDGYSFDACRLAVEVYGRDKWHRKQADDGHVAWLDLEDFFSVKKLEHWIAEAEAIRLTRQKADNARPPQPAVRRLCKDVAKAMTVPSEEKVLRDRFNALPPEQQSDLLGQAVAELSVLRPGRQWKPDAGFWPVMQQVGVILKRRETTDGRTG